MVPCTHICIDSIIKDYKYWYYVKCYFPFSLTLELCQLFVLKVFLRLHSCFHILQLQITPFSWQANKVNLQHIESRPDKIDLSKYEFIVELKTGSGDFKRSCTALKEFTTDLQILTRSRNRTTSNGSEPEGKLVRVCM